MRSSSFSGIALVVLTACGVSSAGCARVHLTESHGRAYHQVFAAQDANPNRKSYKSVHGLDSQEAAVIAGGYRKALAPKTSSAEAPRQMLMVAPRAAGNEAAALPASVPSGQ
jgi:hypothetical protein